MIKDWDDVYTNGTYIANAVTYPPVWNALAAEFRVTTPCETDLQC